MKLWTLIKDFFRGLIHFLLSLGEPLNFLGRLIVSLTVIYTLSFVDIDPHALRNVVFILIFWSYYPMIKFFFGDDKK